ncbi:SDR family oxidoreductase [Algoriphagus hitonicola]|uniref:Short-chain dehydrogenase n=1 Tax=Algoriphagus hitonicola TaxID=435880 RepID=A0A1I2WK17_9BACT|nr:SDR family oxidoreductase [Algoriphagus hitonicola]SFH01710.1 Short-chain dehydrogenase [Algoriphagus hitonicola]
MTDQKVIWITGASSGIGKAAALRFAQAGYSLIISARTSQALQEVKTACPNPKKVKILELDLADSSLMPDKVREAISSFGKVDILLHNAGISQRSLIKDTALSVDRKLMEINFFGTVALTKAILPHFIQNQSGHFGVVTSLVGKFGTHYRSAYAASKHALHGFFDTLRAEHFQDRIGVTLICPGFIRTQVSVNALTADGTPLNEMDEAQEKGMKPEDCAEEIFKAITHKKEEVLIGGKEIYAVYLKRFFPKLFSKILRKAKVR